MFKKEFYSFHLHGLVGGNMARKVEINFCFGLVCKVVVKVQRSSILSIWMGAPHVQKKKARVSFFLSNFMNLFHKFIVTFFLACHFCSSLFSYFFFFLVLWRDENLHA
jgi:hypothetical protein